MKFLKQIQEDCYARALAATELAHIALILQRRAVTVSEVEQLLKTQKGRSGKVGICCIVEMPTVDVPAPDVPGPSTAVTQTFLVLEHPTINAGATGTGTDAETVALDLLQLFHQWIPYGVTQVLVAGRDAITPEFSFAGLVGYTVTLTTFVALKRPLKAALPTIALSAETAPTTATLATATPDAAILYSLDGSYPTLPYTEPLAISDACTLRALATKAALHQSDCARKVIG